MDEVDYYPPVDTYEDLMTPTPEPAGNDIVCWISASKGGYCNRMGPAELTFHIKRPGGGKVDEIESLNHMYEACLRWLAAEKVVWKAGGYLRELLKDPTPKGILGGREVWIVDDQAQITARSNAMGYILTGMGTPRSKVFDVKRIGGPNGVIWSLISNLSQRPGETFDYTYLDPQSFDPEGRVTKPFLEAKRYRKAGTSGMRMSNGGELLFLPVPWGSSSSEIQMFMVSNTGGRVSLERLRISFVEVLFKYFARNTSVRRIHYTEEGDAFGRHMVPEIQKRGIDVRVEGDRYIMTWKGRRNIYAIGFESLLTCVCMNYWIDPNAPVYKYADNIEVFLRNGWWIEEGGEGKKTFSTKNRYSSIVDWVDGVIQDKRRVAIMMEGSDCWVHTAWDVDGVYGLPPSDEYIIKAAGAFDSGEHSIHDSKSSAIRYLEENDSPNRKWVVQPMLEGARRYLGRFGPVTIKTLCIVFKVPWQRTPVMMFYRRGYLVLRREMEGDVSKPEEGMGDIVRIPGKAYSDHLPRIYECLRVYHRRQIAEFGGVGKGRDEGNIAGLSIDMIPRDKEGKSLVLIEVNRQPMQHLPGVNFHGMRALMDGFVGGYEKVLRYLGSGSPKANIDMGEDWYTF